jgi:hypothetical protein
MLACSWALGDILNHLYSYELARLPILLYRFICTQLVCAQGFSSFYKFAKFEIDNE